MKVTDYRRHEILFMLQQMTDARLNTRAYCDFNDRHT
jgi:hypothetical protein